MAALLALSNLASIFDGADKTMVKTKTQFNLTALNCQTFSLIHILVVPSLGVVITIVHGDCGDHCCRQLQRRWWHASGRLDRRLLHQKIAPPINPLPGVCSSNPWGHLHTAIQSKLTVCHFRWNGSGRHGGYGLMTSWGCQKLFTYIETYQKSTLLHKR